MNKLVIKQNKYNGTSSVISARVPDEIINRLETVSAETGRSRNEILIKMIEFSLDNLEVDKS
ncbi:MAG: CopG family transcriptional regulator [Firmicutes bacterium]|nr:CopG family transcriptional regulator [Bacillota bacterium]